jgi:hypothetical protein
VYATRGPALTSPKVSTRSGLEITLKPCVVLARIAKQRHSSFEARGERPEGPMGGDMG